MKKPFLIILAASTVLICIYLILEYKLNVRLPADRTTNIQTKTKKFTSENLGFEVVVPEDVEIDESTIGVKILIDGGSISIGKNGTNYGSLEEHMESLERLNDLDRVIVQKQVINGNESESSYIMINGEKLKSYDFYINNKVYSVVATDPILYDELDQIAQSFKYLGE